MPEKFYKLRVYPSSKKLKISRKGENAFEIWTKEPAERGLANRAAINILAKELGKNPKKILLVKGASSPSKIVKIL